MSSIYQAVNTTEKKNGFIDLDEDLQDTMIGNFKEYQKSVNL